VDKNCCTVALKAIISLTVVYSRITIRVGFLRLFAGIESKTYKSPEMYINEVFSVMTIYNGCIAVNLIAYPIYSLFIWSIISVNKPVVIKTRKALKKRNIAGSEFKEIHDDLNRQSFR
jgi:hypothetical protein